MIYKIETREGEELETHEDFLDCLISARKIAKPIKIYGEADKKKTLLAHRGDRTILERAAKDLINDSEDKGEEVTRGKGHNQVPRIF